MVFCSYILYEQNSSAQRKLTRFQFMCTLIEELCASSENQETAGVVPSASQHRAVLLPGKREKDCVVCSNRSIPGGRKRSRTHCEGCNVGVHLKCFLSWIIPTRGRKSDKLLQNTFLLSFFSIAVAVVYKVSSQSPEHETRLPLKIQKLTFTV